MTEKRESAAQTHNDEIDNGGYSCGDPCIDRPPHHKIQSRVRSIGRENTTRCEKRKGLMYSLKPVRRARKRDVMVKHMMRSAAARHASQASISHVNLSTKMLATMVLFLLIMCTWYSMSAAVVNIVNEHLRKTKKSSSTDAAIETANE